MSYDGECDRIIASIRSSRPDEPVEGTIEYARWLDGDIDYTDLQRVLSNHRPPWKGSGFATTRLEPTPEMVMDLMIACKNIPWLFDIMERNTPIQGSRVIWPRDYKGNILDYLRGTPFLSLFTVDMPVGIPEEQRYAGTWIVAPPGRGKTTLLHSMVLQDLGTQASVILMDSKGDLIEPFRTYKAIQPSLIVIEPSEDFPLALNPFDIGHRSHQTIALLEYIFSALLEAKMTPLQSTLFRCALRATLSINPSMETFREIIASGVNDKKQLPPDLQHFFDIEFPTKTYSETRQQIQWRLRLLLENPFISSMFTAPKTKLNMGKEMNNRKVIIINNSKALLGEEGAEFFGRFFIALVLNAAQQRAGQEHWQKRPCYFYIDECQTVIRRDEKVATILDECRSQKIALTLAHQRLEQISSSNVLGALQNCAIRFANSDDDATALAPKLRTTVDKLRLPQGTFAAYIRDMGALTVKVPLYDLSELPQMNEDEQLEHRAQMIYRYCIDLPQERSGDTTEPLQQIAEHTANNLDNLSTEPSKDW